LVHCAGPLSYQLPLRNIEVFAICAYFASEWHVEPPQFR
jgi:hypothetical protein